MSDESLVTFVLIFFLIAMFVAADKTIQVWTQYAQWHFR